MYLRSNVFPDNLFQAAFQQAHTVYEPSTNPFAPNDTGNSLYASIGIGLNDTAADLLTDDLSGGSLDAAGAAVPSLVRVVQYRPGTNTLGIVFFCLVFGTLLGTIGPKGQVVIDFFAAIFEVVMRMVQCVMWLTPVGISSVIAGKILGVQDLALVMAQLMWFIVTIAVGVFFYQLVVMQLIYLVVLRKNPFKFYWGLVHPMLTAFATAST